MLKEECLAKSAEEAADRQSDEPGDIRDIIQQCVELPPEISCAEFTRVNERLLDPQLLSFLASDAKAQDQADRLTRVQRRKQALSPYLGKILTCVFIRLPGIHYTFEIDPESERVVHWEWQAN